MGATRSECRHTPNGDGGGTKKGRRAIGDDKGKDDSPSTNWPQVVVVAVGEVSDSLSALVALVVVVLANLA